MGDLWSDLKLVLTLIFFIYLLKWSSDFTGSKAIGVILAAAVAYLTFFQHFEILVFILVFFFGYPFFSKVAEGYSK
jgi:hypothetical protein